MCAPWKLNPQPSALLTQCSTTEPQEQSNLFKEERFIAHIIQWSSHLLDLSLNFARDVSQILNKK